MSGAPCPAGAEDMVVDRRRPRRLSAAAATRAGAPRRRNGWLWFMTRLIEIGRSA